MYIIIRLVGRVYHFSLPICFPCLVHRHFRFFLFKVLIWNIKAFNISKILLEKFNSVNSVMLNLENQPAKTKIFNKLSNFTLFSVSKIFMKRIPMKDIFQKNAVEFFVKFVNIWIFFSKANCQNRTSKNFHNTQKVPRKLSSQATSKAVASPNIPVPTSSSPQKKGKYRTFLNFQSPSFRKFKYQFEYKKWLVNERFWNSTFSYMLSQKSIKNTFL